MRISIIIETAVVTQSADILRINTVHNDSYKCRCKLAAQLTVLVPPIRAGHLKTEEADYIYIKGLMGL